MDKHDNCTNTVPSIFFRYNSQQYIVSSSLDFLLLPSGLHSILYNDLKVALDSATGTSVKSG